MSSRILSMPANPQHFMWDGALDDAEYVTASYRVTTVADHETTAIGMAMEQSASTTRIAGYVEADAVADWTIRVRDVRPAEQAMPASVAPFRLQTAVYGAGASMDAATWDIDLAIPRRLLGCSPVQWMNVLIGEIPRLGFITAFRLLRLDTSLQQLPGNGPAFGPEGVMARFGVRAGPVLCRSMRPAVGLDRETMARLNRDVLVGGFHCVKDDELQWFDDETAFRRHVVDMVAAKDAAQQTSGERKAYIATLICGPQSLERRWETVLELGVDGVLVAPFVQGFGVLDVLARRGALPLLAHNTGGELITRNPAWGMTESARAQWMRLWGADLQVTTGDFGHVQPLPPEDREMLEVMHNPCGEMKPTMPILQGGKNPEELSDYRACCDHRDFMLIVASYVDHHPEGVANAARRFRQAVDAAAIGNAGV